MELSEAANIALAHAGRPLRPHEIWQLIRKLNLQHDIREKAWLVLEDLLSTHSRAQSGRFFRTADGSYGLRPRGREASSGNPPPHESSPKLDTGLLLEADLHRWLYRNLQRNGLRVLGLGPLHVYDERRQGFHNLGKFNTRSAGEIDMLLTTAEGDLLVIEIKRRGVDEAVGQICRYMGWVRENLHGRKVLGLIIAQEITDKLRYAVRAAGPNLRVQRLQIHAELGRRTS